jgi:microcystin-dependent protein
MGATGPTGAVGPQGIPGADAIAPAGAVVAFAGNTAPAGWLLCDGASVSRAQYGALFAAIGTAWGEGDGPLTFNVPDLRGQFLRGQDRGTGRDPNAASRTASGAGGNTGDAVGTVQSDQFQGHGHRHEIPDNSASNPGGTFYGVNGTNSFSSGRILEPAALGTFGAPRYGAETRPRNAAVNWIIKY